MLQINISFAPFLLVPSIRYGSWNQALGRAASRIAIALTNRVCIRDSIHTISSEIYGSLLSDRKPRGNAAFFPPTNQPCLPFLLISTSINFILLFTLQLSFFLPSRTIVVCTGVTLFYSVDFLLYSRY